MVDLLAAVPSLIFGMWGLYFLIPKTQGFQKWLTEYFGWIPLFGNRHGDDGEPVRQEPADRRHRAGDHDHPDRVGGLPRGVPADPARDHRRGLALGATKWEMIRAAVLPFGRAGMISAAMLGLGRALGETIAVALVLNSGFKINWHITEPGGDTFASTIANKFGESGGNPLGIPALITAGLFLFVITLVVNSIARIVIARRKEFTA